MIVEASKNRPVNIGRLGENEARVIKFPVGDLENEFPGCSFLVLHRRKNDQAGYPVPSANYTVELDHLYWTITSGDVAQEGSGECQIVAMLDSKVMKTDVYVTIVGKALDGSGTAPDPWQGWVNGVKDDADRAEAAAGVAAHAPIIQDGYWYTWDATTEQYVNSEVKAQGEDGDPGQDATPALITIDYSELTFPVAEGKLCYHSGLLYKANQAIATSETWTEAHWTQTTIEEELRALKTEITHGDAMTADAKSDIDQIAKDGYQKWFPEWERGEYTASGKATNNNRVRSKNVLYLPVGTYTIYSDVGVFVYAYSTAEATSGTDLLWNQTGEKTFNVTSRNYIGIMVGWDASNEEMPTGIYIIAPSAVSDVITQAEKNRIEVARVAAEVEYSDGRYTAVLDGVTEYAKKSIGAGVVVGSTISLSNDNYQNVMEVPVVPGKTYRAKGRLFNNYYLIHFCNDDNVLISKTGQNTTGATTTIVDFTAVAPVGSTKMFIQSGTNTKILADVFEPYTVKQMIEMKDRKAIGSLCVMQFNVGDWYEGQYREADHSGSIPADETIYENYMSLFTSIFDRYKPDIAMINEDAQEMCLNRHNDSRAFLKKYYKYLYRGLYQQQDYTNVYVTLATNLEMEDVQVIFYTDTEQNMTKNLVKGYAYINGRKVCLICTHLSSLVELAKPEATELLGIIQAEDPEYLICCGDFNYDTNIAEIAAFETAGYEISRGNTIYDGHTYGYGDLTVTTPDTITVKSVFCDEQKIEADFVQYIDHLPTIVYLEIF